MAGLKLYAGGFGGTQPTGSPQYGSAASYNSGMSATSAAFAGASTNPTPTFGQTISPKNGFGLAVWMGVGAIVLLTALRSSLPN